MLKIGDCCLVALHGRADATAREHEGVIAADLGALWKVNFAGALLDVPKEWVRPVPADDSSRGLD